MQHVHCNVMQQPCKKYNLKGFVETTFFPPNTRLDPPSSRDFVVLNNCSDCSVTFQCCNQNWLQSSSSYRLNVFRRMWPYFIINMFMSELDWTEYWLILNAICNLMRNYECKKLLEKFKPLENVRDPDIWDFEQTINEKKNGDYLTYSWWWGGELCDGVLLTLAHTPFKNLLI